MTFSDLDDAFSELQRRADASGDPDAPGQARHRSRSHPVRVAASAAAVIAAVAAVAVGVDLTFGREPHHVTGAAPVRRSITASTAPTSSAPTSTAPTSVAPATDVPRDQAELVERFRSILGDSASFTVDSAHSTDNLITGVLTSAAGTRGFYVLEVDHGVGVCGSEGRDGQQPTPLPCPQAKRQADGSELKVDPTFADGPPDGVMDDAILGRPDGWQISLYTANVEGKHYGAAVLGKDPALTVEQVTDVVTSPKWLAK